MEFSFGLKDVMPRNERFTGRGGNGRNSACSLRRPPLSNKNYLCKCKGCRWKALPDKIRCFQTGCRAELADVLSLRRGPFRQKLLMALCVEPRAAPRAAFPWSHLGAGCLRICLASHRSVGTAGALTETNTNGPVTQRDLLRWHEGESCRH